MIEKWIEDLRHRLIKEKDGIAPTFFEALDLIDEIKRLAPYEAALGIEIKTNKKLQSTLATYRAVVEKVEEKIEMIRVVYNNTGNIPNQLWIELGVLIQQALQVAKEGE